MKIIKELKNNLFFDKNKKKIKNKNINEKNKKNKDINSINNNYSNNNINSNNSFNSNNNNNNNNNEIDNGASLDIYIKNSLISNHNNNNNNEKLNKYYSNIHFLDWSSVVSVDKIDLDSNLFLLVSFFNNITCEYNQILLKSSTTIVQEVYASILESILQLPIPEMRLLEYSNDEFISMSRSLLNISKPNQELYEFIKTELLKSFFLIMEFIPNGKLFKQLNIKEYFSGSSGEKKLNQLGQIIAFDIFSNNSERLPALIWDNVSSHFSNILFYDTPNKNGWYFSLINSNVTCINNSSFTVGYRKYITRLKSLLYSIFKNPQVECIQIKKMRETISKQFHISLSSSFGISIQCGLVQGVHLIINKISLTILKDTKEKLKHLVKLDSNNNVWKKGLDSIHLPFLVDVLDTLYFNGSIGNFKRCIE